MAPPKASTTARERARAELTREIKEAARRQLADVGADGLSLRAVARELGMVSSALYRYFPSRDDLLTALIIDAYDAIGSAVEAAIAAPPSAGNAGGSERAASAAAVRERWKSACRAVRAWARAHPHEYALIYGSPVPGYRAPQETVGPAARVPLALTEVFHDAAARGLLRREDSPASPDGPDADGPDADGPDADGPDSSATGLDGLRDQAAAVAAIIAEAGGAALPPDVLVRTVIAWTQLFGMVSFELFGQFTGNFDPADAFFDYAVEQMAGFVIG